MLAALAILILCLALTIVIINAGMFTAAGIVLYFKPEEWSDKQVPLGYVVLGAFAGLLVALPLWRVVGRRLLDWVDALPPPSRKDQQQ